MAVQCLECGNYGTGLICRSCEEEMSKIAKAKKPLEEENAKLKDQLIAKQPNTSQENKSWEDK